MIDLVHFNVDLALLQLWQVYFYFIVFSTRLQLYVNYVQLLFLTFALIRSATIVAVTFQLMLVVFAECIGVCCACLGITITGVLRHSDLASLPLSRFTWSRSS